MTREGALVLLSDGGTRLLTFIANVHLANVLGPESYGIAFLGLTVLSYAMWPADLGLYALGVREMAKPAEKQELKAGDILSLQTVLGLGGMIVAGVCVQGFVQDPTTRHISFLFLLALIPSLWQMNWYYHGHRYYGRLAFLRYLFSGSYLFGVWLLIHSSDDLQHVPLIYTVGILCAAIAAVVMKRKEDSLLPSASIFSRREWKSWRETLRKSTPIGFGSILAQVVQMLPPIVIAALYDEAEVGLFGAAFRLTLALMVIDRTFFTLFLPRISTVNASNPERLPEILRRTFRTLILASLVVGGVMILVADPVIIFLYGSEYADAIIPLAIMSWFVSATILTTFFSYTLVAAKYEKAYFQASLVSTPIAIGLILLLTWQFGIIGTATSIAVAEGIMVFVMYLKFRQHLKIRLFSVR
ncbi:MAG: oligosaccharide flippase family protein [Chlorobi bacterium]|nr:oligosaccharide flippase family protein [Chlorobiota bacterium]